MIHYYMGKDTEIYGKCVRKYMGNVSLGSDTYPYFYYWFQNSSVMTCHSTCQHMTPSTAIKGSKTFSLALYLKSLANQSVRAVHLLGTPCSKLLRFSYSGVDLYLARTCHDLDVKCIEQLLWLKLMYGNWHFYSVFLPIPCYPLIASALRSSHQRWPQALVISGCI